MKEATVQFIKIFKNWSLQTGGSFEICQLELMYEIRSNTNLHKDFFKNEIFSCQEDCFSVAEYILLKKKIILKKLAFCFWLFPLSFGEQAMTHALDLAH